MSALVSGRVLSVTGAALHDRIEIDQFNGEVYVFEHSLLSNIFPASSFTRMSIYTYSGDTIFSGDGNDVFNGGSGNDSMWGEAGDDTFYAWDDSDDYINGGSGWGYAEVDDEPWSAPWQADDSVTGVESRTNH
jgi:Ca2+-binding RTX toxin-like protein